MAKKTEKQARAEGRRQRRTERHRQQIVQAAAQVFAEKGYAIATTKEIAEAADMGESTLYNYFDSKRDILLAVAAESEAWAKIVLLDAKELESREAISQIFLNAFSTFEERLPFVRTLFTEALLDDYIFQEFVVGRLGGIHQQLAAYMTRRVAAGAFRPMDTALCAQMIMGMFASLILPALRGITPMPSPEERRRLASAMVDMLLDGIGVRTA
jgi:AcrR family transcriptional regulator